jgi:dipeptidyl aminopeptidase/acylaminoacyl peptidase
LGWASELRLRDGVADELLGGKSNERPERYAAASPIELLPFGVSQYLLHGTADDNVPFEISQHYYETARAKGDKVELLPLPGMGHFELIDPESKAWPRLLQVVQRACAST